MAQCSFTLLERDTDHPRGGAARLARSHSASPVWPSLPAAPASLLAPGPAPSPSFAAAHTTAAVAAAALKQLVGTAPTATAAAAAAGRLPVRAVQALLLNLTALPAARPEQRRVQPSRSALAAAFPPRRGRQRPTPVRQTRGRRGGGCRVRTARGGTAAAAGSWWHGWSRTHRLRPTQVPSDCACLRCEVCGSQNWQLGRMPVMRLQEEALFSRQGRAALHHSVVTIGG